MERSGFVPRAVLPAVPVLVVMAACAVLYDQAWRIPSETVHQLTAYLSGIILFVTIGFGPLYVYPRAFFRGAGVVERILASLVTPLAWNLKEIVRVSEFFTWGESFYYGLNQLFLSCLCVGAICMGLCEMACRWTHNRETRAPLPVVTPAPLIAVLAGLVGMGVLFAWGMGVHWFYIYQEGYKALFT